MRRHKPKVPKMSVRLRVVFATLVAVLLSGEIVAAKGSQATTIYLVRHAERSSGARDAPLSDLGMRRARGLAGDLENIHLDAIYATEFQRTQQTVAPTAQSKSVDVRTTSANKLGRLIRELRRMPKGSKVLVASHSWTIPRLVKKLGVRKRVRIRTGDYGDLFVIELRGRRARLVVERFEPADS